MAKTSADRSKTLTDGPTWSLETDWGIKTGKYQKDLSAPIFKAKGNMVAFAHDFDVAQNKFEAAMHNKNGTTDIYDTAQGELEKLEAQMGSLDKQIEDIANDESASIKPIANAKSVEDVTKNWENWLKVNQSMDKQAKSLFDNQMKLYQNYTKKIADTIAQVKKEAAAQQSIRNVSMTLKHLVSLD
jgi:archaellum component FlaC